MNGWRTAGIWACGLGISSAIANLLCLLFVDSTEAYVWDDDLELSIRAPGQIHRNRLEGWADTRIGRYSVNAIDDVGQLAGDKIIFWGDSHVEGFPLADDDKIAQQFNRLPYASEARLSAFAFGISGGTIATTYHLLPTFERLVPSVRQHVIVITRLHSILPDNFSQEAYALRSGPPPNLEPLPLHKPDPGRQAILSRLRRLHLPLPYQLFRHASGIELRLLPQPATEASREAQPDYGSLGTTWSFLMQRLQERTDVPLAFVYCPPVPILEGGRVVVEDPNGPAIRVFQTAAREHGFPFLSLRQEFLAFHRANRRFPRGFANNHPYRGHLNRDGIRLVAERVARFLAESSPPSSG